MICKKPILKKKSMIVIKSSLFIIFLLDNFLDTIEKQFSSQTHAFSFYATTCKQTNLIVLPGKKTTTREEIESVYDWLNIFRGVLIELTFFVDTVLLIMSLIISLFHLNVAVGKK